ncbi:MAG TPA: YggT family protein [Chthonomonadaceae bacterium]|nr:YggT family protein [Chthonomonadaceae bacterium]
MSPLETLIRYVIWALIVLILIDAVIANIIAFGGRISTYHPLVRFVRSVVTPIEEPVRRILPPRKTGGLDLSPLILILLLEALATWI